jgi:hypothetical protein
MRDTILSDIPALLNKIYCEKVGMSRVECLHVLKVFQLRLAEGQWKHVETDFYTARVNPVRMFDTTNSST